MNVDMVMMAAILSLVVGLVPQILKNHRTRTCGVAFWTTLITTAAMWVLVWCFWTLGMWFSFAGCVLQGFLWATILGQWWAYRVKKGGD